MPQLYNTVSQAAPLKFGAGHVLNFANVSRFLEFDKNDLSKIGEVSVKSVRLDDRMPNALKERLEQIANVCNLVAEYFDGDAEKTALWFHTSNPMLGDMSPRDMVRFGRYRRLQKFVFNARAGSREAESRQSRE